LPYFIMLKLKFLSAISKVLRRFANLQENVI
jgi:hypothetical protein